MLRQRNSQTCDIKSTLSAATAVVARRLRMSDEVSFSPVAERDPQRWLTMRLQSHTTVMKQAFRQQRMQECRRIGR
jgi:hypothetical protein